MWEALGEFLRQAGNWWDGFSAWWMNLDWNQIKEALTIGLGSFSAFLTVICFILKLSGDSKAKITADKIGSFNEIVRQCVMDAENMTQYNGEEKKAYALQKIKVLCEQKHINFTDEEISLAIEAAIKLSKTVNYKK